MTLPLSVAETIFRSERFRHGEQNCFCLSVDRGADVGVGIGEREVEPGEGIAEADVPLEIVWAAEGGFLFDELLGDITGQGDAGLGEGHIDRQLGIEGFAAGAEIVGRPVDADGDGGDAEVIGQRALGFDDVAEELDGLGGDLGLGGAALEKKCDTIVLLRYVVLLFRRYDSYCTYHERYESYQRSTFSYSTLTK